MTAAHLLLLGWKQRPGWGEPTWIDPYDNIAVDERFAVQSAYWRTRKHKTKYPTNAAHDSRPEAIHCLLCWRLLTDCKARQKGD